MLKILFFAGLRDALGTAEISWPVTKNMASLLEELKAQGEPWQKALGRNDVLCAKNQELCDLNEILNAGDEIAFFPPVTGG